MEKTLILNGPKLYSEISRLSVGQQLHEALIKYQNLDAAVDGVSGTVVSFKHLLKSSSCLAHALQTYGCSKHTIIGMLSENSIHVYSPLLAMLYLGCTVTMLSPTSTEDELLRLIRISKPSTIFCSKKALKNILLIQNQVKVLDDIIVIDTDNDIGNIISLNNFITQYTVNITNLFEFNPIQVNSNTDVAFIQYSSGTTGLPKGVPVTHRSMSANFVTYGDPRYYTVQRAAIGLASFSYMYGFGLILRNLLFGTTTIIFSKFDQLLYLKAVQDYKISKLSIVPALASLLVHSPLVEKFDLSSVKYITSTGESLSVETENLLRHRFTGLMHVQQMYGLTETLTLIMFHLDDSKTKSCGKLVPNTSAKVLDQEGNLLRAHCIGEFWFKGETIMKGYLDVSNKKEQIPDNDGWFATGDIGYYDTDGYFYVIGRIKDMIKYKGYQIAPAEVETVIVSHPDIVDAAVIGIPHKDDGELPCAFVVRKTANYISENEVQSLVAEKLSPQKWLRGGVVFVEEIPRNSAGKILRRLLKQNVLPSPKL